jgi:hypothetical protein
MQFFVVFVAPILIALVGTVFVFWVLPRLRDKV